MSLQWTIAAGLLYLEIAVVIILVLPIASPRRWNQIFQSRFLSVLQSKAKIFFNIIFCLLVVLLLDAIREMRKYSNLEHVESTHASIQSEMQNQLRLFRAQRNFYISGFTLFLSLVIYRLVWFMSTLASAMAQNEATMRQALGASAAARSLLNQTADAGQNAANEANEKKVTALQKEIETLKTNIEKEKTNSQALKAQAEATNKEYDRLTAEYSKLEKKIATSSGDKKDD